MLLKELPEEVRFRNVAVGAGEDDCAVVRAPKGNGWQLLKTDCVIEGVHFPPDTEPWRIGWKALCRPLSDIAATGGKPAHALGDFRVVRQCEVRSGHARSTRVSDARRGNSAWTSSAARPLPRRGRVFSPFAMTGRVARDRCVTRGGGRVGDALFVTGDWEGLLPAVGISDFRPRLEEAQWLVSRFRIRAMMDLSDGLAADLPRMARASGTGFVVEPARLPRSTGCTDAQALGDGEDYELLFAATPRDSTRLDACVEAQVSTRDAHLNRQTGRTRHARGYRPTSRATTISPVGLDLTRVRRPYLSCARTSCACLTRRGRCSDPRPFGSRPLPCRSR